MKYVSEISGDAGRDMWWNPWIIITTPDHVGQEDVQDVLNGLKLSEHNGREPDENGETEYITFEEIQAALHSTRWTVEPAKCVFVITG